mgnify:CR=1 FL=1
MLRELRIENLLLIGAAAFGIASIVAAFSTSAEMLIVTRALLVEDSNPEVQAFFKEIVGEQIDAIAKLPSRDVLYGRLVGVPA